MLQEGCPPRLLAGTWWGKLRLQSSCYQRCPPIRRHPRLLWQRILLLQKEFQVGDLHDGGELTLPETTPSEGVTVATPACPASAATMAAAIHGCDAHRTAVTSNDRVTRFNLAVARYRSHQSRCDVVLRKRAMSINCPRIRQLVKRKNLLIMRPWARLQQT